MTQRESSIAELTLPRVIGKDNELVQETIAHAK